jgi:hypothetical protein
MGDDRRALLGFDQRIRLEWLDEAARHAAAGQSYDEMRDAMLDRLDGVVGGRRHASARSKTVTVICRIWGGVVPGGRGLRARAIEALSRVGAHERAALHWAMSLAAYPFFFDVGSIVGRLLELQEEAPMTQIVRRAVELWGDREKVRAGSQKVVRSMADWGCLSGAPLKGVFRRRAPLAVREGVALVVAEALLLGSEQSAMALPQLLRHPAAFPFHLDVSFRALLESQCFEITRQSLDVDVVSLRARA